MPWLLLRRFIGTEEKQHSTNFSTNVCLYSEVTKSTPIYGNNTKVCNSVLAKLILICAQEDKEVSQN
ncbi:hypothetical protein QE152_g24472 [Popillia japonica]|uniref:Uncharacterized protein n=1 Tax=Popillia japonica TaxID=7064 RepID=A0AAW1KGD4_POPJA